MNAQIWIVLAAAMLAGLFFGRRAVRTMGRKGGDCGCCGGGACGKPKDTVAK